MMAPTTVPMILKSSVPGPTRIVTCSSLLLSGVSVTFPSSALMRIAFDGDVLTNAGHNEVVIACFCLAVHPNDVACAGLALSFPFRLLHSCVRGLPVPVSAGLGPCARARAAALRSRITQL